MITGLRYLNHSDALFTGKVPHQLGSLTNLQYLDLSWHYNRPPYRNVDNIDWLSNLSSLQYLDMSGINLTKVDIFNAITKLSSLSVLHLSNCNLKSIPVVLPYVNLTYLSTIDISENDVSSMIPNWLLGMHNLVSYNGISTDISKLIRDLSGCARYSLQRLKFHNNLLHGKLPDGLAMFSNLTELHAYNNFLSGCIPESIGSLSSSLMYLYLANNRLEDPIPEAVGELSELVVLDLSFNPLGGLISNSHFAKMTKLEAIFLSSSSVTVNMSSDWTPHFQLKNIRMGSCVLGPEFPTWLKAQRNKCLMQAFQLLYLTGFGTYLLKLST
ncbi:uncharacterized protein A4U43_C07F21830 [Asparagus officinalis]|uniref:Leucine-rich repeat-containing N-terminal plant-type domain-containing protein n=1 Tax=Asparagus officinalis TaxID=4686 RepID=A0A5P1EDU8_ASPOF|nr:uncharacterized protein A4U43_C07F21830 [Asparagus officinalis]